MKTIWLSPVCLLFTAFAAKAAEQKPNILWITGEDMSAKWLGCDHNHLENLCSKSL